MPRFSTANLDDKFKFGNKNNNPVNNVLLWRASVKKDNEMLHVSPDEAKNPHVQVNPYRGLLSRPVKNEDRNPAVANKLQDLDALLKREQHKRAALERKLNQVLGQSEKDCAGLIQADEKARARSSLLSGGGAPPAKGRRRRIIRLRLPRTKPPPLTSSAGPSQVSYKNRQTLSHSPANYSF